MKIWILRFYIFFHAHKNLEQINEQILLIHLRENIYVHNIWISGAFKLFHYCAFFQSL